MQTLTQNLQNLQHVAATRTSIHTSIHTSAPAFDVDLTVFCIVTTVCAMVMLGL